MICDTAVPLVGKGWETQSGRGSFVLLRDFEGCGAGIVRTLTMLISAATLSSSVLSSLLPSCVPEDSHHLVRNMGWYIYGAIVMGLCGAALPPARILAPMNSESFKTPEEALRRLQDWAFAQGFGVVTESKKKR